MLRVQERPPLRLSVNIETPSGRHARWGADDPLAANQPQQLTFSTVMPGGFDQMSCTLQRDPRRHWPDIEELSDIKVRDAGSEIVWEGRQEALPDDGGSQAQLTPQAVGYQSHLDDDSSAREIYLDGAFGGWQGASVARQIILAAAGVDETDASVSPDPVAGEPSLATQLTGAWARQSFSEGWYDAKGIALGSLYYAWKKGSPEIDPADGNWQWMAWLSADDVTGGDGSGNLRAAGPGSGVVSATGARTWALVQLVYDVAAGGDGVNYPIFWTYLGVVGQHGLPIQGTLGASGGIGVLASDVIAHAIGKWAPDLVFTTGPNGTIQPSVFVIPQLAFTDPTTAGAIIKQAVQYELLDWAVGPNKTLYVNRRGESPLTRNWRARVGPAQLQEAGPDISRLCNGVFVQYTDVSGVTRTAGPPGSGADTEDASLQDLDPLNPANQAGIVRSLPLQMGTTTATTAVQAGAVYLKALGEMNTSGQASLVGHVQDDRGVWWPASRVRAGDTITFTDARDTSPRRIVSTSYAHQSKTNAVQLDQPPDTMSAVLADLAAVIAPLGLS